MLLVGLIAGCVVVGLIAGCVVVGLIVDCVDSSRFFEKRWFLKNQCSSYWVEAS